MCADQIKTDFEQAAQHLKAAKSELNRPAEDVVPFMVCRNARHAISHYLHGFILKHNFEFDEGASVATMLQKCKEIDGKFKDLDLSAITFKEDDEYSAEFDAMEKSIGLAEHVRQLVGE